MQLWCSSSLSLGISQTLETNFRRFICEWQFCNCHFNFWQKQKISGSQISRYQMSKVVSFVSWSGVWLIPKKHIKVYFNSLVYIHSSTFCTHLFTFGIIGSLEPTQLHPGGFARPSQARFCCNFGNRDFTKKVYHNFCKAFFPPNRYENFWMPLTDTSDYTSLFEFGSSDGVQQLLLCSFVFWHLVFQPPLEVELTFYFE